MAFAAAAAPCAPLKSNMPAALIPEIFESRDPIVGWVIYGIMLPVPIFLGIIEET